MITKLLPCGKCALILLCTALLLGGCASTPEQLDIQRIVVFGDSNVDTGNLQRLAGSDEPLMNSWRGRNSNGPVVPDYLAEDLNAELKNYAVGGATSGDLNVVAGFFPAFKHVEFSGVSVQLNEFVKAERQFKRGDLVILWAGSNDIVQADRADKEALNRRIMSAVNNIETSLNRFYDLGARKVVVATRTARSMIGSEDDLNGRDLNRALTERLNNYLKPDYQVHVFDAYASIFDMAANPSKYGFSAEAVNALCVDIPDCKSERFETGLELANTYINWDFPHKTTRVHRIMADQILKML